VIALDLPLERRGAEAQKVDRLLAFQIYQAQHLAGAQPRAPRRACRHDGVLDDPARWDSRSACDQLHGRD
jgi:hypothetical protein